MTPIILQPLFEQWRKEGIPFCVTNENYNKTESLYLSDSLKENAQIGYPFLPNELWGGGGKWLESNLWNDKIPDYLPSWQVEKIAVWLLQNRKKIYSVTLYLTSKCNYACPMCTFHGKGYLGEKSYFQDNPQFVGDMELEKAYKIIDKVSDYGISRISLTTQGEPLLYPHLIEVIKYCKAKGFYVVFTSNGSLMDKEMADKLKDARVDEINFSIDSIDEEVYKQVRSPNHKYYKNALQAPIIAKNIGIYTAVHFTEQKVNKGGFKQVLEYYRPHRIQQIRNGFECEVSDKNIKRVREFREATHYIHGLCAGNEYIILLDGTLVGCCSMYYFINEIKNNLPNVLNDKTFGESLDKLHNFLAKNPLMIDKCKKCGAYVPSIVSTQEKRVEKGYFVLRNFGREIWFCIPEKISSLPDDVLLYMYQNNLVTKMKQDGIL